MTDYLIGTGGWSYFKVPGIHPLVAYSRAFNYVEVNSTFYEIPKIEKAKSWRNLVQENFEFSVRCNQRLTHELKFSTNPEAFRILVKMVEICDTLKANLLHFQTPPSFEINKVNIKKMKDFFSSANLNHLRIALEVRNKKPLGSRFLNMLQELDIIHCIDLLKQEKPTHLNDILYTRLFGKGPHNIYQPLDSELKQIDETMKGTGVKKAVVTSHSVRMFKDAARFRIYKETGEFPNVTNSTGIDSLVEVLEEDARFPTDRRCLLVHQGWKVIDLTSTRRVYASYLLSKLPEKTYYGIEDIVKMLGDLKSG